MQHADGAQASSERAQQIVKDLARQRQGNRRFAAQVGRRAIVGIRAVGVGAGRAAIGRGVGMSPRQKLIE